MTDPLLKVEVVTFDFKTVTGMNHAAKGVSHEDARGETLAVVGEDGSGKSTLGMAMIGLGAVHAKGRITFDGDGIDGLDLARMRPYRPRIQVVFQDPCFSLNPRMIVRQILEEGLIVSSIGASAREREQLVKEALSDVLMEADAMTRFPHQFSGGQRQRIAIAIARALQPAFILLEDPVAALDLSIQAQIIDLLRDLMANHDLSYIFISHDLKVVKTLCHKVIVMKNGRMVEAGPTSDLLENPKTEYTRRLVDAAFNVVAA